MHTDKHIQKLAHKEVESESVGQLIDSAPDHCTIILSAGFDSELKFRGRWVLDLV
jgi:hypothetical protein